MNSKKIAGLLGLILIFALLAGCGSQAPATPTIDPKQVYTEVAQTFQAQQTNSAKLTPKPTSTPQPTDVPTQSTPKATATLSGTKISGTPPTQGTPGLTIPSLTAVSTSTLSAGQLPAVPDKMVYVSQSIPDGAIFSRGEGFTMVWTIKNTGTTTWNQKYFIRLYGGERAGAQDENLDNDVAPNATYNVSIPMTAPNNAGKFNTWWVISNADMRNFGSFNFEFEVK